MKSNVFILLALIGFGVCPIKANPTVSQTDTISVYIFLHDACRICQHYTVLMRELHESYANEQIQFIGLFPNASSNLDKIAAFKTDYAIPFDLYIDHAHLKTNAFGVMVTPEVVVYNESSQQILYKGRIDNAYARVGKKRQVTSSSELKDTLEAIQTNHPIPVQETKAIGCLINKVNFSSQNN